MPNFGPIKRRDLIAALRKLGWTGPESGGRHQYMRKGALTLTIPNSHHGDIGVSLLKLVLSQAGITRQEWEKL